MSAAPTPARMTLRSTSKRKNSDVTATTAPNVYVAPSAKPEENRSGPEFLGPLLDLQISTPPELKAPQQKRQRVSAGGGAGPSKAVAAPKPPAGTVDKKKTTTKKGGPKKKRGGGGKFKIAFTNRKDTKAKALSNSTNNELAKEELLRLNEEQMLELISWGLPDSVVNRYRAKGVTSLFPWQLKCLANEKVLEGRNLLYSAPTSAGKTLVAEILMIKRVLELGRKAMMILPFVSVCREKMYSLQEIFGDAGIRVEGFMGSYNPPGGFKAVDIAICTIEKANSLINRMLEEDSLSQLGTIVVDEMHLIGDPHRGYLLELLLTKVRFMMFHRRQMEDSRASEGDDSTVDSSKRLNIQIIGMSATLPNLALLSEWLDAELVTTDYRPVPLLERISFDGKIYDKDLQLVRNVRTEEIPFPFPNDDDHLGYLSLETVLNGHSILIFCPTKAKCEFVASHISENFFKLGNTFQAPQQIVVDLASKLRAQLNAESIKEVLTQLRNSPGGSDETLNKVVKFGVAFHHAGLTYDERDIIESAFKRSVLRVIVATSTLSAGVNLPARRVVINTPMAPYGQVVMDVMTYQQMCGRAGRKGVDTEGESILICPNRPKPTKEKGIGLVQSTLPVVKSALLGNEGILTASMKRALLEVIASGIVTRRSEVENYAKCTLLSRTIEAGLHDDQGDVAASQQNKADTIQSCLKFLEENDFIRLQKHENKDIPDTYMATQLGSACLAASMDPDEGIKVYKELQKARKSFRLSSELHVIYQVTPIYLLEQLGKVNWTLYEELWQSLDDDDKEIGNMIGVEEVFIIKNMLSHRTHDGGLRHNSEEKLMIHIRFYAALALSDLVNEMSISKVADKYNLNKGVIQTLQQSASTFAGMVTAFCGRLEWNSLELLLSQFQERLQFGVQRELCDLVRLSLMNGHRARILYNNGIKTVAELAASDPASVEAILHRSSPFQSAVHGADAGEIVPARHIWMMGKTKGLTEREAAQKIVEEARQFIQAELGLQVAINFGVDKTSESHLAKTDTEMEPDEARENTVAVNENNNSVSQLNSSKKRVSFAEADKSKSVNHSNNSAQEAKASSFSIFEDSFPEEVNFDELSLRLRNTCDMEEAEMEKLREADIAEMAGVPGLIKDLVDSSMDISDSEAEMNGSNSKNNLLLEDANTTPKSRSKPRGLLHSTPGRKSFTPSRSKDKLVKNRLSSIIPHGFNMSDLKSPVLNGNGNNTNLSNASPLANKELVSTSTPKNRDQGKNNLSDYPDNEINADILAALESTFDSSSYKVNVKEEPDSFNVSRIPSLGNDKPDERSKETNRKIKEEEDISHKLSESDAVALAAIANESFSEDMFAGFDEEVKEEKKVDPDPPAPVSASEDPFLDDPELEAAVAAASSQQLQTPSKTGMAVADCANNNLSTTSNANSVQPETSTECETLESSTDFSSSQPSHSSSRNESLSARNPASPRCRGTFTISGRDVKVMEVRTLEFLPPSFINESSHISLSLRFSTVKRAISIARMGIGARIVGLISPKPEERIKEHTLTLYNGGDTIWSYTWQQYEAQDPKQRSEKRKLRHLFRTLKDSSTYLLSIFDAKTRLAKLLESMGRELILDIPKWAIVDPKIAQWVLHFEEESWKQNLTVEKMAEAHLSPGDKRILSVGWGREVKEAFIAWHVMERLQKELTERQLWTPFIKLEMPSTFPLLLMEMNGFGIDSSELNKMKDVLQYKEAVLELKAYHIAGKQFSLSSPKDVKQVLFRDLGLKHPAGGHGTGKDVLSKLDHEIGQIIMEWRKVNSALQKIVIPFQHQKSLETGRIHGTYSHFTVTGRVVMSDPSLQCVPRDFDLTMDFSSDEVEDVAGACNIKFGSKVGTLLKKIESSKEHCSQSQYLNASLISMRNVFVPCNPEFVLLSADYSQLELRILAHLCKDKGLVKALNKEGGDVFKSIAASWKKISLEEVTPSLRQEAKGIVYGVIYGMGPKALSVQMEVDEQDAVRFISEFMRSYPGIRVFLEKSKENCRKKGYIETMTGRRRYLPLINSDNPAKRAQAERQAINSQIQGSASDLVKTAMATIAARLAELYPETSIPIDWANLIRKNRNCRLPNSIVYFPVLNLHDELIFEVRTSHLTEIAREIRAQMELCLTLAVRTPVVIKVGNTWGSLSPME